MVGFNDHEERKLREDQGSHVRQYVDVVTDAGANFNPSPTTGAKYLRVVFWLGTWHAQKNALQLVMKVLKLYDASQLITTWGWESEKAHAAMYSCGNLRKSQSFLLDGLLPAMWRALVYEFMATRTARRSSQDIVPMSEADFLAYIGNPAFHDETSNNFILMMHVIVAYKLMCDGIACNSMSMYDCGRAFLLDFMFTCNHRVYGPLTILEFVRLYHQIKEPVREHRARFFTPEKGKSWDERMEEQNRMQKSLMSDKAPTKLTVMETSLTVRSGDLVRANIEAQIDVSARSAKERSHVCHDEQVQQLTWNLIANKCFMNIGRKNICTLSGEDMEAKNSIANMQKFGNEAKTDFFNQWCSTGTQPKFPKAMDPFLPKVV